MADFETLDARAERALTRYLRLREEITRLHLGQLEARAVSRVADALGPGFSPARSTGLRSLAALARRKAAALDRLVHLDRALAFLGTLARVSRQSAGLGRGISP